jgi:predicted amidophosphoribosyltransferase
MICFVCKGNIFKCDHSCICAACNGTGKMIVCQHCGLNFSQDGQNCQNCRRGRYGEKRLYLPFERDRETRSPLPDSPELIDGSGI